MKHAKVVRNTIEDICDVTDGGWNMVEDVRSTMEGGWNMAEDVQGRMEDVWKTIEGFSNMEEGILDAKEGIRDVTEDICTRGMIRAAHRSRPRNDNEEVEENTEQGDTKDN